MTWRIAETRDYMVVSSGDPCGYSSTIFALLGSCNNWQGKGVSGETCNQSGGGCLWSCNSSYSSSGTYTGTYSTRVCLPPDSVQTCGYKNLWDVNVHHRW
jgi:hypothetical protein